MRHLLRSVLALSALGLSVAAHADTFAGTASFTDGSSNNNSYQFSGSFANPSFSFSGGVGTTYSDQLTITSTNVNCTGRNNPCNAGSDALSVTVAFTKPNNVTSGFSGSGSDTEYFTFLGVVENADIDWTNNNQTVAFADGSSLMLSLADTDFSQFTWQGTTFSGCEDLTMTVKDPPAAATPEPSSLVLLGSGLAGLGGTIRRKLRR